MKRKDMTVILREHSASFSVHVPKTFAQYAENTLELPDKNGLK
jgi:hypothetical protein